MHLATVVPTSMLRWEKPGRVFARGESVLVGDGKGSEKGRERE